MQSITTVVEDAAHTWRENPHLGFCFADLGHFTQAFIATRHDSFEKLGKVADRIEKLDAQKRNNARARLELVRHPDSIKKAGVVERDGNRLVLWLYGIIGEQVKADEIIAALKKHEDADSVVLRICSSGGDAHEALAIAEALSRHTKRVIAIVDLFAFSAAADIAAVANRLVMRRNSIVMFHQSWATYSGNANDLQQHASGLRGLDQRAAGLCARRRRITAQALYELMRNESYLSAEQALEAGIADDVINPIPDWQTADEKKL